MQLCKVAVQCRIVNIKHLTISCEQKHWPSWQRLHGIPCCMFRTVEQPVRKIQAVKNSRKCRDRNLQANVTSEDAAEDATLPVVSKLCSSRVGVPSSTGFGMLWARPCARIRSIRRITRVRIIPPMRLRPADHGFQFGHRDCHQLFWLGASRRFVLSYLVPGCVLTGSLVFQSLSVQRHCL